MSEKPKRRLITVEVDEDLYQKVRSRSKATGLSIAFKVRGALQEWVWGTDVEKQLATPVKEANDRVDKDFDFGR